MDVICVSVLGENFPSGTTFLPSKFFLSADQPRPESNFQITLSSQGQKVPNFPSRFGRAKVQNFLFSRLALPHVNFMWEFLHQHGARWPLLRAYESFPHPCSDLRWVSRSPHFAKVGQNFPFHAAHLVSPISGDPSIGLRLSEFYPLVSHPPFRGNAPKVSDPGYLSRLVSCCVVWASVLPLSDCPPRSHLRKFSSPSYPLENVALRLLEKESLGPTLWSLAPQPRIHGFFLLSGGHAVTSDWLPPYNRGPRIRHPT